ncbi:MAG: spore coat protein CotJB [Firmicutes bacterium]|nr:spore coat protein CotJB [Bacillota bacterium]
MTDYQRELMHALQANSFALVELQLYLDTHPDDVVATRDFAAYGQRQRLLRRAYEQEFGPLQHYGESTVTAIDRWVFDPWPWEI